MGVVAPGEKKCEVYYCTTIIVLMLLLCEKKIVKRFVQCYVFDIYIYIYTTVNATICSLLVATVPRCKLLTWTTCFGHEDHLQVHIEPRCS